MRNIASKLVLGENKHVIHLTFGVFIPALFMIHSVLELSSLSLTEIGRLLEYKFTSSIDPG